MATGRRRPEAWPTVVPSWPADVRRGEGPATSTIMKSSSRRKRSAISTNLELCWLDPVRPDLDLEKGGPAGLPPGEHVEEAAQRPAVRGTQAVEDLHGPHGRADLGEPPGSRGGEPLRAQLAAEGIGPRPRPSRRPAGDTRSPAPRTSGSRSRRTWVCGPRSLTGQAGLLRPTVQVPIPESGYEPARLLQAGPAASAEAR